MAQVYIGIGSNLAEPLTNCRRAIESLSTVLGVRVRVTSNFYRTEPVGLAEQNWFINAVALIDTALEPAALLTGLKLLEEKLGREAGRRWGPRLIDLDILLCDQCTLTTPALVIPHPRMHERRFVLAPMCDLAPSLVHPRLGLTMEQLLARLPAGQIVETLDRESLPW